jgi:hypothetical protein
MPAIIQSLKPDNPIHHIYVTMSVTYFKNLCDTYTTWADLNHYLTTPEGGSLRVIPCDTRYTIIRYDKAYSKFDLAHVPWFRSVVWDTVTNRPVCIAPPKATEGPIPVTESLRYEEFLEGVMINAFLNASGEVVLATRSKLGATGTFYSSRSFQDLLTEALNTVQLKDLFTESTTFISLLLQHPDHRIVAKLDTPRVYIIHTGSVESNGTVTLKDQPYPSHLSLSLPLSYPPSINTTDLTTTNCTTFVQGLAEKRGWMWQGIVAKDGAGRRYRMRSNAYSMIRTLRGDSPRQDVRFLKLRSKQLLETYLYYYADEKDAMWGLEQRLRAITQQLYQAYVNTHITHAIPFTELPAHLKTHVFSLHSLYLGSLKARGFFVRKQEVIEYMNRLPIPRILHLFKSCA